MQRHNEVSERHNKIQESRLKVLCTSIAAPITRRANASSYSQIGSKFRFPLAVFVSLVVRLFSRAIHPTYNIQRRGRLRLSRSATLRRKCPANRLADCRLCCLTKGCYVTVADVARAAVVQSHRGQVVGVRQ